MTNEHSDTAASAPPMEVPHILMALVALVAVIVLGAFTTMEMVGTTLAAAPSTPHAAPAKG